jgi:isoamylase
MKKLFTQTSPGVPYPLGATKTEKGWNFSVYSDQPVILCLAPYKDPYAITELAMESSGSIWHLFVETTSNQLYYGYKVAGNLLIDPYARAIDSSNCYGNNNWSKKDTRLLALTYDTAAFDWEGDLPLHRPKEELIIYEMHVRGFTNDDSSNVDAKGTFQGMIEKIPYLKELGVTAVELLPIWEFDETEYKRLHPQLVNYWGYSPLSFFCPMMRYATSSNPLQAINECKRLIKELHRAGIEVILDIVLNHTGEGNEYGPILSWKGLSKSTYYLLTEHNHYYNFSGCGNTFNCNHPIAQDLIIESLRYWITEFHIDGFRFDLAAILSRGREGKLLTDPPLLERITQDPIIKKVKLIAEPWDAAGLHQVGSFFQKAWKGSSCWMEWNDDFRTIVRRFIKGDHGYAGKFATKISGSEDIYASSSTPLTSVNYVTCHDGFTLHDLVSYNHKHNQANGENNHDGIHHNDSWNCGAEGETKRTDILRLREKQIKNLLVALFISQGVPMLYMGDEYGHTKQGNNNTWCQDNRLSWFLWDELHYNSSLHRFVKELIHFRKSIPLLNAKKFLTKDDVDWHGSIPFHPDWGFNSQFVACTRKDHDKHNDLYIAFNASSQEIAVTLPTPSYSKEWHIVVNTGSTIPQDFIDPKLEIEAARCSSIIKIAPHSSIVLLAKDKKS